MRPVKRGEGERHTDNEDHIVSSSTQGAVGGIPTADADTKTAGLSSSGHLLMPDCMNIHPLHLSETR